MKKLLVMVTIVAFFTACGGGKSEASTSGEDSLKRAGDSIEQTGDTSAMNSVMGDTTSASGINKSGVGGGNTGGPQKKGDSAK